MAVTVALERWRPIPGYEGLYEVSDLGQVRSLFRRASGKLRFLGRPRILKPGPAHAGRLQVVLRGAPNSPKTYTIHRLVLEAFVGPRPSGAHGCHYDGDCKNNRLTNLRWDTPEANIADDRRNGVVRGAWGEKQHQALLTEESVRAIRAEPQFWGVCSMLARCFGVCVSVISSIRRGETWKHVAPNPAIKIRAWL